MCCEEFENVSEF